MGSRTLPYDCKHGKTLDWGDFGPDPDDGQVGAQECLKCQAASEDIAVISRAQAEAMFRLLIDEGHMTPVASTQLRKLWITGDPDD